MKRTIAVCLVLSVAALFFACGRVEPKRYQTGFFELFDTYTELTIYAVSETEATAIATVAKDELTKCHQLFDIYHEYQGLSNLKTVNDQAGIVPVTVDQRIIDLLIFGKKIYRMTGGQVNVAMGSVLSLWHEKRTDGVADPENAELPDMVALREAAQHTDIEDLIIDEQAMTVYLADEDMSLDVGAIAKGFATERAAEMMIANGAESALLSVGGNVRAVGVREDGTPWQVGVQNPDLEADDNNIATVELAGSSMVTSGNYQRFYIVDGMRYHHIIDPKTLMPGGYVQSVTIQAVDSGIADALSTALFTVSIAQGKKILSQFEGTQALWIDMSGKIEKTDGFILE